MNDNQSIYVADSRSRDARMKLTIISIAFLTCVSAASFTAPPRLRPAPRPSVATLRVHETADQIADTSLQLTQTTSLYVSSLQSLWTFLQLERDTQESRKQFIDQASKCWRKMKLTRLRRPTSLARRDVG